MTNTTYYQEFTSPIGRLLLVSDGAALTGLSMSDNDGGPQPGPGWMRGGKLLESACEQLDAYFSGASYEFDIPLAADGTDFQKRVWRQLQRIPFGETISYGEQARRIGQPKASRAVGRANGQNPIAIVVPCHRVIGADGTLTGFGGGIDRKKWLLDHEASAKRALMNAGDTIRRSRNSRRGPQPRRTTNALSKK